MQDARPVEFSCISRRPRRGQRARPAPALVQSCPPLEEAVPPGRRSRNPIAAILRDARTQRGETAMLRFITRSCLGLLLLCCATTALAFSTGPPVSRTNARALGIYPAES